MRVTYDELSVHFIPANEPHRASIHMAGGGWLKEWFKWPSLLYCSHVIDVRQIWQVLCDETGRDI